MREAAHETVIQNGVSCLCKNDCCRKKCVHDSTKYQCTDCAVLPPCKVIHAWITLIIHACCHRFVWRSQRNPQWYETFCLPLNKQLFFGGEQSVRLCCEVRARDKKDDSGLLGGAYVCLWPSVLPPDIGCARLAPRCYLLCLVPRDRCNSGDKRSVAHQQQLTR